MINIAVILKHIICCDDVIQRDTPFWWLRHEINNIAKHRFRTINMKTVPSHIAPELALFMNTNSGAPVEITLMQQAPGWLNNVEVGAFSHIKLTVAYVNNAKVCFFPANAVLFATEPARYVH